MRFVEYFAFCFLLSHFPDDMENDVLENFIKDYNSCMYQERLDCVDYIVYSRTYHVEHVNTFGDLYADIHTLILADCRLKHDG